jgi:hypothetical protein
MNLAALKQKIESYPIYFLETCGVFVLRFQKIENGFIKNIFSEKIYKKDLNDELMLNFKPIIILEHGKNLEQCALTVDSKKIKETLPFPLSLLKSQNKWLNIRVEPPELEPSLTALSCVFKVELRAEGYEELISIPAPTLQAYLEKAGTILREKTLLSLTTTNDNPSCHSL